MNNKARVKTILLLAANPRDTSKLQLDVEVREIDEGLRRANKREQFKLEQKWAVRSRSSQLKKEAVELAIINGESPQEIKQLIRDFTNWCFSPPSS